MRDGGAGVHRGTFVAVALLALFVGSTFLPLATLLAPTAAAQSGGDPWWGPSDRNDPTAGWAIRIPVVVENKYDYPLGPRSVVHVDVDFGKALVNAGWTSQQVGAEARLRGFTLDVDSIRVIEYSSGFSGGPIAGAGTAPTPHVFYEAPFDADRYRAFDPARNPYGTVMFLLEQGLPIEGKRYFYIYANPIEFGKKAPVEFALRDRAELDSYLWGTSGTVLYGYEPAQTGTQNMLSVKPLTNQRTTVIVYEYSVGRFVPVQATPTTPNPLVLDNGAASILRVESGKAFKLEADRPITAYGQGQVDSSGATPEAFGYYPSVTGSYAGRVFNVVPFTSSTVVTVYKAAPGTVTVTSGTGAQVALTNANPSASLAIGDANAWSQITATGNILVAMPGMSASSQAAGPTIAAPTRQIPALTGGPSGLDFYAAYPRDGGWTRVCPEEKTALRIVVANSPSIQEYPPGPLESTPAGVLSPSQACTKIQATAVTPHGNLYYYAVDDARYAIENAPVPFRVIVGAGDRANSNLDRPAVGSWGGLQATDFRVVGKSGIFGHFNDTRVTIFEEHKDGTFTNTTVVVSRDGFQSWPLRASTTATGVYRMVASKPISVVSTEGTDYYARFIPGRPSNANATLGMAEFRGPLVELRSPDTEGRQLLRSTGPGTPITFRLNVFNLGQWIAKDNLPDTITLSCTGPTQWLIEGCGREVQLRSGDAERIEVTITPGADDVNSTSSVIVSARSKNGGPIATFRLDVYVEIRYGVGLWFDVENGRKTIDPAIGVDPGRTHTYTIVMKNTGSTDDTFLLRVGAAKEGWTQSLTLEGEEVTSVRLAPGESRNLFFAVKAPDAETAPQNLVSILAESTSSDLASAKDLVNTATRIRPKININLELDPPTRVTEPNVTAVFNVTVRNAGNDIFRIKLHRDGILPEGWNATLSIQEVDLGPGGNYTFQALATPPPKARAGDILTLKIVAAADAGNGAANIPGDEVSAVVVVRRIHNLTTPPLLDAQAQPGETLRYVLPLTNRGNGDDTVEIKPGAPTLWPVTSAAGTMFLPLDDSGDLVLDIVVPPNTPAGSYTFNVTLRLADNADQVVDIPIQVAERPRVLLVGARDLSSAPGRTVAVQLTAINNGNVPGEFAFGATVPSGWNVTYSPPSLKLAAGARAPVTAYLTPDRTAVDGLADAAFYATLAESQVGTAAFLVDIARPELFLANIESNGAPSAGDLLVVSATVGNRGGIAAENVSVVLVVDGTTVDQVTLARIPVDTNQVATLNWLATRRGADVRVIIDPSEEIVMTNRDANAAEVTFGSKLFGIPTAGAMLTLAAAAMAVAFTRRRPRT